MVDVIASTTPVARKEHRCDWCALPVKVGVKYLRDTVTNDGDIYTWVSHIECQKEIDRLYNTGGLTYDPDGWPKHALVEYVHTEDISEEWKEFYKNNEEKPDRTLE